MGLQRQSNPDNEKAYAKAMNIPARSKNGKEASAAGRVSKEAGNGLRGNRSPGSAGFFWPLKGLWLLF